ncbi:MAG TPA: heparinase II/III family protein [Armatimonadota bacterium]|nr:heparinase II/III family protein [Armatimonadota bacterium]
MVRHAPFLPSLLLLALAAAPLAAQHPRAFLTEADVPRLRAMVTAVAPTSLGYVPAEAWQALKAQADAFVEAGPYHYEVEMPGQEGGPSQHWEYTLTDHRPPRHDEYGHYPPWTAMFQERADSITTRLKYLSFAYVVSGDGRYLDAAKAMVLHLCAWPGIWTDESYGGGRPCLDTGHAAEWVGLFYDWCYHGLTAAERQTIRAALAEKALAPIDATLDMAEPYHNFTAVIATGLCVGAIALHGEDARADAWISHAIARAKLNFDAQGKDGGAMEGPMYGTYAASMFADMIWALTTAGVENDLAAHPYIESMPRYCISLLDPGTRRQPCFGDGGPTAGFGELMLILALRGSADAAWYCQQIGQLDAKDVRRFLALDPARIRPAEPTWSPSGCFVDVGYAILRDGYSRDSAFMALKCGPPEADVGHNHFDHNSFVISFAGAWPAWDPGYRSYFDPPKRRYTTSTLGHNTIVVDLDDAYLASQEAAQPGHDQLHVNRGRITEFYAGPGFDYALGDAANAYNTDAAHLLDAFTRQIVFVKPSVFFIRDHIAAPQEHTYSFLLHVGPEGQIETADGVIQSSSPGASLEAHVFAPGGVRLAAGAYPGAEEYGPYASATTGRGRQMTITSVLVPRRTPVTIVNGGFEQGFTGWQRRDMPGFTENHVIDHEAPHAGSASGRIDNGGYYYTRHIPVSPGTQVTARWWARCTSAEGASSVLYYWRSGTAFASTPGPSAVVDEWAPFELTDTVPEGAEEVCLALQFFGQGQCWYDDVEMVTDAPVPVSGPARVRPIDDGQKGAVAEVDGAIHVLVCGSTGHETRLEAAGHVLTTDAELAVVSFIGDGARAFVVRGTRVEADGRPVRLDPGEWRLQRGF